MAAAGVTLPTPNNHQERLPFLLYRSRTKKSTVSTDPQRTEASIPVIDLEALNDERRSCTINQIGDACKIYGFFVVKNHGVPELIRNKMLETTTNFFHLPEEEKMKFASSDRRKKFRLVTGNNSNGNTKSSVDSWRVALKFNFDADAEEGPTNPPSFKEDVAEYAASMSGLVKALLEAISESLGLEKDYIEKIIKKHRLSAAFNHYPLCPNPKENLGAIPHSDPSVITIVQLDDVPGLQFDHNGDWLAVNPIPDTLLINVGEILQVISNDRYKSMCHQVTANSEKERVSLASFCFPSFDAIVGPAEKLVDDDHPPLYSNFSFGQFLGNIIARGEPSASCA